VTFIRVRIAIITAITSVGRIGSIVRGAGRLVPIGLVAIFERIALVSIVSAVVGADASGKRSKLDA
jgi:hypothetical protein